MLFCPNTTSCGESKPAFYFSSLNYSTTFLLLGTTFGKFVDMMSRRLFFALIVALLRVAKGEEAGQPGAGNMRQLVWDEELEAMAQR